VVASQSSESDTIENSPDNLSVRDGKNYQHILPYHHHSPIVIPNVNFVANGHPYKITVNNKDIKPSNNQHPSIIINPTNSPVTWITNTWGFNGRPVNIFSYTASRYFGGRRRRVGQWGQVVLG
jgi:hypothetical protein